MSDDRYRDPNRSLDRTPNRKNIVEECVKDASRRIREQGSYEAIPDGYVKEVLKAFKLIEDNKDEENK